MNIFILGLGYTGKAIAEALRDAGHRVTGLSRSPGDPSVGVGHVVGDVLEEGGLRSLAALPAQDLMISALSGAGHADLESYRRVVVEGPRRAVEQLPWSGIRRVLFLGSTGVYGGGQGEWVDEHTSPDPGHPAGERQLEAEAALASVTDEICVLRLSGLYGPGRTRLIRQALRKRPYLKPDIWSNNIHRDDVAGIVRFLVGREAPLPKVLLASDDRPALRREIFDWVRARVGAPEGWFDEGHPERATRDRGNKRVRNAALRRLGAPLRYPSYQEGLVDLLPTSSST